MIAPSSSEGMVVMTRELSHLHSARLHAKYSKIKFSWQYVLVFFHDIFNDFSVAYDSGVVYITNRLYEAVNIMCGVFSFEASMELWVLHV
jgi:hypothetical protein